MKKITDKQKRRSAASTAGQSIPSRWIEACTKGEYVDPTSFGFDKARLGAKPTRTMNRIRMNQRPRNYKKRCEAPGCGGPVFNLVHGRGACANPAIRNLITDSSNQSVHIIADAVSTGNLEQCTILVNAGTKYATSKHEDFTIPDWALPGTPGRRSFPDKPDIVVIKNWQRGAAPPTNAKRTPGYTGPVVTSVLCEHRITNDFYLQAACDEKRSIYVELVLALIDEGWAVELDQHVSDHSTWYKQSLDYESRYRTRTATPTQLDTGEHDDSDAESSDSEAGLGAGDSTDDEDTTATPPSQGLGQHSHKRVLTPARLLPLEDGELASFPIHTVIVGHIGSHLASNKRALLALGIPRAKQNDLLLALSTNAVQRTHHCLATYKHVCRASRTPSSLQPPSVGVG